MRKPVLTTGEYGDESVIVAVGKYQVRTPAFPADCDYVRVVKVVGKKEYECVYWNSDEWQEKEDGAGAMGALMGAIKSVADGSYAPV